MRHVSQKGDMNRLTLSLQHSIVTISQRGWSARRIAREMGINRETVGKHLLAQPATVTTASPGDDPGPEPAIVTTGSERGRSSCEPWRSVIEDAVGRGLSAVRIHHDLIGDHGFQGCYEAVKRFVRRNAAERNLPFRRMECAPGEEMQVDFGTGAWVVEDDHRRRPHLFRAVLSHSRKGYTEVVWRQTTETFIRCLENAFRHFGGVASRTVVDNLKAAVLQADWFDPDLNPKLVEFCRHYGTILAPTKPAMPRHKGKVEAGVKYVQDNALKGRTFTSLAEQNEFLAQWERSVADTRIHGTVRQQVLKLFATAEQHELQHRGPEAIRTLHGLLHLAKEHQVADLERVTERALEHACFRLRDLRTLLKSPSNMVQLGFLQAHPIIREMSAYRIAFPPRPKSIPPCASCAFPASAPTYPSASRRPPPTVSATPSSSSSSFRTSSTSASSAISSGASTSPGSIR